MTSSGTAGTFGLRTKYEESYLTTKKMAVVPSRIAPVQVTQKMSVLRMKVLIHITRGAILVPPGTWNPSLDSETSRSISRVVQRANAVEVFMIIYPF